MYCILYYLIFKTYYTQYEIIIKTFLRHTNNFIKRIVVTVILPTNPTLPAFETLAGLKPTEKLISASIQLLILYPSGGCANRYFQFLIILFCVSFA
jgi:hypothetical protein